MEFEIGKQIKNLRIKKGVTQEDLANYLGISYQAISKWENGLTAPDIQLLPLLSVYFGITIDELFQISNESHMERIENMLHMKRCIIVSLLKLKMVSMVMDIATATIL